MHWLFPQVEGQCEKPRRVEALSEAFCLHLPDLRTQLSVTSVSVETQISVSQEPTLFLNLVKYILHLAIVSLNTTTATLLGGVWSDSGSADPTKLYEYVGYDAESGKHICLKCSNFSHKSRSNARNHVEAVHFPALFTYSCQACGQETGSKNALNIHMTRFHKTRQVAAPPL